MTEKPNSMPITVKKSQLGFLIFLSSGNFLKRGAYGFKRLVYLFFRVRG